MRSHFLIYFVVVAVFVVPALIGLSIGNNLVALIAPFVCAGTFYFSVWYISRIDDAKRSRPPWEQD
jgi:hypothetical protein